MTTATSECSLYQKWWDRTRDPEHPWRGDGPIWMTTAEYLELRDMAPGRDYPVEPASGGPRLFGRVILLTDQFDTVAFTLADEERRYIGDRQFVMAFGEALRQFR